jgi:hypothetical protein
MEITTLKRTGNLIATIFFLFITLGMMRGSIQNQVEFAGVANEIGFTVMTMWLTGIFAYLTVTK